MCDTPYSSVLMVAWVGACVAPSCKESPRPVLVAAVPVGAGTSAAPYGAHGSPAQKACPASNRPKAGMSGAGPSPAVSLSPPSRQPATSEANRAVARTARHGPDMPCQPRVDLSTLL